MSVQKDHALFAALALLPAMLLLSCSKKPATQAAGPPPSQIASAPDTSTPKKASLAFAKAMVAGDADGMRSVAVGTGGHVFAFYTGFAATVTAQRRFKAVLTAKFGADCKLPEDIEAIGNLNPMPPDYDKLTEKIDGDAATLVDATGHTRFFKLKKMDGNWKVDFDDADAALPSDGVKVMNQQEEIFAATKSGFDAVTDKITGGKYTDCQSAIKDVEAAIAAIGPRP